MRNAWLMGLMLFCALASGGILVQGRSPGDEGPLAAALVEQASQEARAVANELGLAAEPERGPSTFYRY